MDKVTCHCLQGDTNTNYTKLLFYFGYTRFLQAMTGGKMQSTTLRKKIKLELKHSLFRARGGICLFSQLWLFSTLDTASLAQG